MQLHLFGILIYEVFNEVRKIERCKTCKFCGNKGCIHNVPLLAALSQEEIDKISEGVEIKEYKKGDMIFKSGDKGDRLFIVCSGKIKIYTNLIDGREQILYVYTKGDFVGAFNLIKETEFKYNAEALEATTISTISKAKFDEILLMNPKITLKILEKSYERVRLAESLIKRLTSNNADAKVAGLLLSFADEMGKEGKDGIVLELSMNREEMGSYAGMARETMTRKLNQYKEEGYIDFSGNKIIIIKNRKALEDMFIN